MRTKGLSRSRPPILSTANDVVRKWVVYPLIIAGVAVFYLQEVWTGFHVDVLPAVIAFVSIVVVETVQRLERLVIDGQRDREFDSLAEAEAEMRRIVAKDRRVTKVQVIAGPDRHVLTSTLPSVVENSRAKRVDIDLQFVDEHSPLSPHFPPWWTEEAGAAKDQARELYGQESRVRLKLSKYKYLPVIHGVLINERYLFLGFWGWGHGDGKPQLSGSDRPQRLYVRHDPHTEHFFYLFEDWFENPIGDLITEVDSWQGKNWRESRVRRAVQRIRGVLPGGDEESDEGEGPQLIDNSPNA